MNCSRDTLFEINGLLVTINGNHLTYALFFFQQRMRFLVVDGLSVDGIGSNVPKLLTHRY